MKLKLIISVSLAFLLLAPNSVISGSHGVKGYIKKDGIYVAPHQQTNRNETQRDNWTSKPNVNPYTGKKRNQGA
jgi:hypothetical protein